MVETEKKSEILKDVHSTCEIIWHVSQLSVLTLHSFTILEDNSDSR